MGEGRGNSGRGRGNSGCGGARGRGQGHEHQQASPKSPNFKGETEELGGMIFELGEGTKQTTSYNKAVDKIRWYFNVKMSNEGGSHIAQCIFDNLAEPTFTQPDPLPAAPSPLDLLEQKHVAVKAFNNKVRFDDNRKVLYALTWGQRTDPVRSRLGQMEDFMGFQKKQVGMALLRKLRSVMQNHQEKRYGVLSRANAKALYYAYRQPTWQSVSLYHEGFLQLCETLEAIGAHPRPDKMTVKTFIEMGYGTAEAELMAIEAEKAAMFLRGANSKSYKVMDSCRISTSGTRPATHGPSTRPPGSYGTGPTVSRTEAVTDATACPSPACPERKPPRKARSSTQRRASAIKRTSRASPARTPGQRQPS
jgi:hypothetical protein